MADIIAFSNEKGGSGKTTTALAFSAGLRARGYSVLSVDMDGQGNFSYSFSGDTDNGPDAFTVFDILTDGATLEQATQHTTAGDIITANKRLATLDRHVDPIGAEFILKDKLEDVRRVYDYIIIDTAPTLSKPTLNALIAADHLVVPTQADVFGLEGAKEIYRTYKQIKKHHNKGLQFAGIVLTRYNGRNVLTKDLTAQAEQMAGMIGSFLYRQPIREGVAIKEAQAMRQSIFEYAPRSHGAEDYNSTVDEYITRYGNR